MIYLFGKNSTSFDEFFRKEIEFLTKKLLPKVKANYYLWTYLTWLFSYFVETKQTNLFSIDLDVLLLNYLNEFKTILYLSPSDYSVFHSRFALIDLLRQRLEFNTKQWKEFILKEFELIDDLLLRYPFYVTTWNYCKYFLLIVKLDEEDLERLNKELNINLENLFFRQNFKVFYLHEKTNLHKRYIDLAAKIAVLFNLDKRENSENVERLSQNFAQFLNKFIL